jgi:hypothetical protein
VNYKEDAEYRKRLAQGFLNEARVNFAHQLWRSCVDNSQLSIENSGKMIIALFSASPASSSEAGENRKEIFISHRERREHREISIGIVNEYKVFSLCVLCEL